MPPVHSSAVHGFTTTSAESYEKGRPTYSDASLRHIASVMNTIAQHGPQVTNRCIVELGAGTGKFTTSLVPFLQQQSNSIDNKDTSAAIHPSFLSPRYIATEPSEGFRSTLEKKKLQHVEVTFGTGQSIPANTGSVDMIIAAQAFHWMANQQTIQECHRALRPGSGVLLMIWNTYNYAFDWVRQCDDQILTPAYAAKENVPRQQNGQWRQCFQSQESIDKFGNLHAWYHPYSQSGTREMVVNRIMSTSVIVEREESYQQEMLARLNHILDSHPDLESSRKSGIFTMPYITEVVWAFAK
jgi:SAM-dependent methyltransferase